jgi:hypothetical protein
VLTINDSPDHLSMDLMTSKGMPRSRLFEGSSKAKAVSFEARQSRCCGSWEDVFGEILSGERA